VRHVRRLIPGTTFVAPWTMILILAGGFQLFRAAYSDAVIFLVPATLLAADTLGLLDFAHSISAPHPNRIVLTVAAAMVGLVLVVARRHSLVDALVLWAIAFATLPLIWTDRREEPEGDRVALRRSAILWAAVGILTCAWEVVSFVLGIPSEAAAQAHPTISILLDPVVGSLPGRMLFVLLWLSGGMALLRLWRRP
jgi:hypothetical protein